MNRQLQELADIHYGRSPATIRAESSDIPIYATSGQVGWATEALFHGPLTVVARKGTLDNPTYSPGPCWVIDTAYAVVPKQHVDGKWLYYALSSFNLKSLNEATGVPSISRDYLYRITINTPDCPEQRKIAHILSTMDDLIERTEALIAKYRAIKQGLMHDLLTRGVDVSGRLRPPREEAPGLYRESAVGWVPREWEVPKIGDFTAIVRGASPRPKGDPRYYGGNVPRLMVEDITRDGKYVTPKVDFLTEEGAKLSRPMPKGSLIVVCSGTVGIPAILAVDACIHDGLLGFSHIDEIADMEFLYYLFWYFRNQFDTWATHGGVFTNLTTDIMRSFPIALPYVREQRQIVSVLKRVDSVIDKETQAAAKHRLLKAGLMQDLLTGRVRAKV